jgi:hypothetical protein
MLLQVIDSAIMQSFGEAQHGLVQLQFEFTADIDAESHRAFSPGLTSAACALAALYNLVSLVRCEVGSGRAKTKTAREKQEEGRAEAQRLAGADGQSSV